MSIIWSHRENAMAITRTDFMRGMQCRKMLWLDKHKPSLKVIPPEIQARLDAGFQYTILKRCRVPVSRVYIVLHGPDEANPFLPVDVTTEAKGLYKWINDNIWDGRSSASDWAWLSRL